MIDITKFTQPCIDQSDIDAVIEALSTGVLSDFRGSAGDKFLGGKYVRQFEDDFSTYFNIKHSVSFNSCTSALHAACLACGIRAKDEVIVTPYTFISSAKCVSMCGAIPVWTDIEKDIYCLDPADIERKITEKTRAIIVVHLFGHPANMGPILRIAQRYNLKVIEDAAQAIGATYRGKFTGTMGDCGVFSFDSAKTISTGEGGMLITNNDKIAHLAQSVRNHGEMTGEGIGYNYRLTEFQSALGSSQLKKLNWINEQRQEMAYYLNKELYQISGIVPPLIRKDCTHTFFNYAVRVINGKRDKIVDYLNTNGIYMGAGYIRPLYNIPLYGSKNLCPVAEKSYKEVMCTCIVRPPNTLEDMKLMVERIKECV